MMIKIREKSLNNGLNVLAIKNPAMQGVNASLYVKSGSCQEADSNSGISHLLEHLIFYTIIQNSRSNYFPLNLELKALTGREFTFFEITHHKDCLKDILSVLFSAVSKAEFNQDLLNNQKSAIEQEIAEDEENPFSALEKKLDEKIYAKTSLQLPILGNRKSLSNISFREVEQWHQFFYTPENMLLAVSGNFDDKKLYSVINKTFAKLAALKNERVSLKRNNQKGTISSQKRRAFDSSYLAIAFPTSFKMGSRKYFECVLLANIFDYKFKLIKNKFRNTYDIDIYFHQLLGRGEIRVLTSAPKTESKELMDKLANEIIAIDFSESFFAKAKKLTEKEFLLREDDLEALSSIALYKLSGEKTLQPREEAKIINSIDYPSLKKLQKQLFNKKNCIKAEII
ncbi:MAG: pitrilysin family protein [Candidatus Moranbacteria bacterium]|nr:pitrilysin family protein [Candidatus Moranbacteria bacterium]